MAAFTLLPGAPAAATPPALGPPVAAPHSTGSAAPRSALVPCALLGLAAVRRWCGAKRPARAVLRRAKRSELLRFGGASCATALMPQVVLAKTKEENLGGHTGGAWEVTL